MIANHAIMEMSSPNINFQSTAYVFIVVVVAFQRAYSLECDHKRIACTVTDTSTNSI